MIDEREFENLIERVPAAPDRLFVIRTYPGRPGSEPEFEALWGGVAVEQAAKDGCIFQRLHRDAEKPAQFVSYDLWKSRQALINAIRSTANSTTFPVAGRVHETYARLSIHVRGHLRDANQAHAGQVASVRHFYLKVNSEPDFERLWTQSAQSEAVQDGCLYKRLHRDLNLPTHYVSYSLWTSQAASDYAASQHAHWQDEHEPYPLASPVIREMLEVRAQVMAER
jgi:quinol monooxygenase YgiN